MKTRLLTAASQLRDTVLDMIADDCGRVLNIACTRYKALIARAEQQPSVGHWLLEHVLEHALSIR